MCGVFKFSVSYVGKSLSRMRSRTITNVLGYTIALALMISLVSLSQSFSDASTAQLKAIGNVIVAYVPAGCESEMGSCYTPVSISAAGVWTYPFKASVTEQIRAMPEVADAVPYISFTFFDWTIGGIDPSNTKYNFAVPGDMVEGRFLTSDDENVVLLDQDFATARNIVVGDTIQMGTAFLDVVGIIRVQRSTRYVGSTFVYVTLSSARRLIHEISDLYTPKPVEDVGSDEINAVAIKCTDTRFMKDVATEASLIIAHSARAPAATIVSGCGVKSGAALPVSEQSAWIIALVSAVSASAVALKSQLAAVVERKKEIGLLKAVGWTNIDVLQQISGESIIQALLGGLLGFSVGSISLFSIPSVLTLPEGVTLSISTFSVVAGLAVTLLGGTLAGVFPAWKAARMKPAEALRSI